MNIELDIKLISESNFLSPLLLSIGYGNGHVVIEIEMKAVESILDFITTHRMDKTACCMEIGRFALNSVTLTLSHDFISIVIDTNLVVGNFGQSAGIYIPKEHLEKFVAELRNAQRRHLKGSKVEGV